MTTTRIEGVGKKNLIIRNTLRLFKQSYWYILEIKPSYISGGIEKFIISVCQQDMDITKTVTQRLLFKVQDSSLNNVIQIKIPEGVSIILESLKIFTLGLLDTGINTKGMGGVLGSRFVQDEDISVPILSDKGALKSYVWDGVSLKQEDYNFQEEQTVESGKKTYFRLITQSLNLLSEQQLIAWIKRNYSH